jgi:hypothetical protein
MPIASLREHLVNGGRIERTGSGYRLLIPPTGADAYADAQLDDYDHGLPRRFADLPPQVLRLRARFSHAQPKGTAGFGFWNHPFSREGAVLEPPCNCWFFYSSPESDLRVSRRLPGHGFKASLLNSAAYLPFTTSGEPVARGVGGRFAQTVTRIATSTANLMLKVPVASRAVMAAAQVAVNARELLLDLDMTAWHTYEVDWLPAIAVFRVDGREVLRAPKPPRAALGFATWIDNYRATASSGGDYGFAYVGTTEEQWMELDDLAFSPAPIP